MSGGRLSRLLHSLVLAFFGVIGCATRPAQGPAGHIILDQEHAGTSDYWQPGEAEVQSLDRQLAHLFAWPDRRLAGMEGIRLGEYGVKYYGTVKAGRRIIVGNGVHVSQRSLRNLQEENARPGLVVLDAFGGGSLYFTAIYDVATKRVVSVQPNAPL